MLAPAQRDCLFGPQVSATSEFLLVEFAGAEEMEVDRVAMVDMVTMVAEVGMVTGWPWWTRKTKRLHNTFSEVTVTDLLDV